MWYSYRGGPFSEKYRIGYAESFDAIKWVRKDELVRFENTDIKAQEMLCYPYVFKYKNNYGKTGIGLAVLNSQL